MKNARTMRRPGILALRCFAAFALSAPGFTLAADDAGAKVYNEVCTTCHTPKNRPLDGKQLTKDQWNEAVQRMKGYGADIPNAKIPQLLDYLARTHGPADAGKK